MIEARRHDHLECGWQARRPAFLAEVVCDRGEYVGHAGPDVALAVTGEIDGVFAEARRHELRLPHGAGPGAEHGFARDVLLLQNQERGDQLVAKVGMPPACLCERGQRADHVPAVAARVAIVGLTPQIARTRKRSTPYSRSTASSVVACSAA